MNKIIKPSFYDDFACIADKCKANCCTGWRVEVSKNSYELAKKTKMSSEMREKIDTYYKRNKKRVNLNGSNYAYIQLREDKTCSFLDEQGLCLLQKECGYKLLSSLCQKYPRTCYTADGNNVFEFNLDSSCEAVVELLLKQKNGIEFISDEIEMSNESIYMRQTLAVSPVYKPYYWDIRTLSIAALQSTQYSLDDRMLILGLFIQKIHEFEKANELNKIPAYVDNMISLLENGEFKGMFDDFKTDSLEFLNDIFSFLVDGILQFKRGENEQSELLNILKGVATIQNDEKKSYQFDEEKYSKQKELFAKYCEKNPRAIENIMVNNLGQSFFPFRGSPDGTFTIWKSYIEQCVFYNMTKLFCSALLNDDLSDDAIVDGVRLLSREFSHTNAYIKMVDNCVEKSNDKLADMAFLVKN